jgi:hypothetical protein
VARLKVALGFVVEAKVKKQHMDFYALQPDRKL